MKTMAFDSPPHLTASQFDQLARMIREDSGIVLTQAKRDLLMARLNRRLRALGLPDYSSYCSFVNGPDGQAERRHMISAVTTNVTAFFREEHHFNILAKNILPPLIQSARKGSRVRFWSSACSSGEEVYSIAMTILDCFPDADKYDILVLGTDIDPAMVIKAEAGSYEEESLHTFSAAKRDKYFQRNGENSEVRDSLRRITRFAELNLHGDWPFTVSFDVIFCRNVVIYFDDSARQRLWKRFARQVKPDGHLFIGHSERVDGPASSDFMLSGTTWYARLNNSSANQLTSKEI